MEQQATSPLKAAINYGLLTALGMVVYGIILYLVGMDKNPVLPYVSYIILLAGIYLGSVNYRDKHLGGFITYGKAVTVGFFIALVVAVIMAVWTYIFIKFIDSGAMAEAMILAEERMAEQGMSEAEIEQGLIMAEKFQSPGVVAALVLFGNALAGFILALITSAFVKKEGEFMPPAAEEENA